MREKKDTYIINFVEGVYLALDSPVKHSTMKIIQENRQDCKYTMRKSV